MLLLRNTTFSVNYFFWLLNQPLLFQRHSIGILQKRIPNMHLVLRFPHMQKCMEISILKMNLSMINQLNFKKMLYFIKQFEEIIEP